MKDLVERLLILVIGAVSSILVLWLVAVVLLVLAALGGCQQAPYRPGNEVPWNRPPCGFTELPVPCQPPVVREQVSACEKRFGKICNQK